MKFSEIENANETKKKEGINVHRKREKEGQKNEIIIRKQESNRRAETGRKRMDKAES